MAGDSKMVDEIEYRLEDKNASWTTLAYLE